MLHLLFQRNDALLIMSKYSRDPVHRDHCRYYFSGTSIQCFIIHNDLLICGNLGGDIKIWDIQYPQSVLRTLQGHTVNPTEKNPEDDPILLYNCFDASLPGFRHLPVRSRSPIAERRARLHPQDLGLGHRIPKTVPPITHELHEKCLVVGPIFN